MCPCATTSSRSRRCSAADGLRALPLGVGRPGQRPPRSSGRGARLVAALVIAGAACLPSPAAGQGFEQRGFGEGVFTGYPQETAVDPTQAVLEALFRYEATWRPGAWKLDGALDARFDSHDMTERHADLAYWDRTIQRPMFAVRRLGASWAYRFLTIDAGKQFVRWGKTDILTPTDRFAPRDYLGVVNSDVLAVTAVRAVVASSTDSFEVVLTPRMTPSRMPLLDQRWIGLPPAAAAVTIVDAGARYPEGTQVGGRWNHIGRRLEHSISVFRGFDHLPLVFVAAGPAPGSVAVRREYAQLTSVGADLAAPLPWFTLKAEAAWLGSDTSASQELVLYVVQAERQAGEWLFIVGYAGEHVTREPRTFRYSPDRGLTRAIVGRASLTIDTNRSLVVESVVRQNGDGAYGRFEYSQAIGPHWRVLGQAAVFRGVAGDYLGQYRRNSFGAVTLRYSF
jgi:hypothetical protein